MKHLLAIFTLLFPAASVQAGFLSGQSADLVLGGIEPAGLLSAADIAVDPASQKVFVADTGRHRVLRFSSAASLQNGGLAEAVFGAADMYEQAPGTSATQLNAPEGLCADSGGRLWVADSGNNRVLRFDNALTAASGAAAAVVLGQPNFSTSGFDTQSNRMRGPKDVEMDSAGRLWVADSGNKRVLRIDNAASRSSGVNADGVLGQPSMTTANNGAEANAMDTPTGLAVENAGGTTVRLWVVDWYNSRVLGFNNPGAKANGAPADKLLGQTVFGANVGGGGANRLNRPYKAAVDGAGLWVADFNNGRALYFAGAGSKAIGANADVVLGQVDFNSMNIGASAGGLMYPISVAAFAGRLWIGDGNSRIVRHDSAATKGNGTDADGVLGKKSLAPAWLNSATDIAIEPYTGKLFVADPGGNRVLRYPSARSLQADTAPEAVLGQPDFTTITGGRTAAKMDGPGTLVADALGNLWVADTRNRRVLRFANAATAPNGAAASQVLGQSNFTNGNTALTASGLHTPAGLAVEWGFTGGFQIVIRRLWVVDRNHNRVLRYENPISLGNGGAASGVLGAPDLTTAGPGTLTAAGLYLPSALAVDTSGRLWVGDDGNDRVLRFDAAATKANFANADGVLLQPNFTSNSLGVTASVSGLSMGPNGTLYLSRLDRKNVEWHFNAASKPNGSEADGAFGDATRIYATNGGGSRPVIDPFSGRLWVGSGSTVLRFTPDLTSRITQAGFNTQNRFALTINGPQGEIYDIRSSVDLLNWDTIERTDNMSASGVMSWTAPSAPTGPARFYRLQVP